MNGAIRVSTTAKIEMIFCLVQETYFTMAAGALSSDGKVIRDKRQIATGRSTTDETYKGVFSLSLNNCIQKL